VIEVYGNLISFVYSTPPELCSLTLTVVPEVNFVTIPPEIYTLTVPDTPDSRVNPESRK
jgi:hypothetical protein